MDDYTYDSYRALTELNNWSIYHAISLTGGGFLIDAYKAPNFKRFVYDNTMALLTSYVVLESGPVQLLNGSLVSQLVENTGAPDDHVYFDRRTVGGTIEVAATVMYTEGVDADGWVSCQFAALTTGQFAAALRYVQVGDGSGHYSVGFQVFNLDFSTDTPFIVVSDYSTSGSAASSYSAALGNDKILVTYALDDDTNEKVYYKIYDYSGVLQSSGDIVSGSTSYSYNATVRPIIRRTNGDVVVSWAIYKNPTEPHVISSARKINANGTLDGMAWEVCAGTIGSRGGAPLQSNRFILPASSVDDTSLYWSTGYVYDENANLNQIETFMPILTRVRSLFTFELSNKNLCFVYDLDLFDQAHRAQIWISTPEIYVQITGTTYTISTSYILGGVTVRCYRDSDGSLVDTQISDGSGNYTFTFLQELGETYTLVGDKAGHIVGAADNITPAVI